jgi:2-polyprenyl-3-methyl-5-hydroxy-6-metoxy-1,4-benzoquinol methylase
VNTTQFWNNLYKDNPTLAPVEDDSILRASMQHFGDIRGARLLDLGCGNGSTSLFFAKREANVVAIDISDKAIVNLSQFFAVNSIDNITPVQCSALDISRLGTFDFVFGKFILHHIEPFDMFAKILGDSVAVGGKAFFHENNAFSDLLIWCRNNLVGKFGIPKYGDDDEFPLLPSEVENLREHFSVDINYPELIFFGLASVYLLKGAVPA